MLSDTLSNLHLVYRDSVRKDTVHLSLIVDEQDSLKYSIELFAVRAAASDNAASLL